MIRVDIIQSAAGMVSTRWVKEAENRSTHLGVLTLDDEDFKGIRQTLEQHWQDSVTFVDKRPKEG